MIQLAETNHGDRIADDNSDIPKSNQRQKQSDACRSRDT
jgi:hypothetical protein